MLRLGGNILPLSLPRPRVILSGIRFIGKNVSIRYLRTGCIPQSILAKRSSTGCLASRQSILPVQGSQLVQIRKQHEKPSWNLVYEGPLSKSVRYVKVFSLTTAFASLVGSPILVYFGKQSVPLVGKLAIAGLLCLVGTSTTCLLHWITKAYVHKMYFDPSHRIFSVETLSLFGRAERTDFSVEDVIFPKIEKAFSTFEANGKEYFIHQEMVEAQQVLQFVRDVQNLKHADESLATHNKCDL